MGHACCAYTLRYPCQSCSCARSHVRACTFMRTSYAYIRSYTRPLALMRLHTHARTHARTVQPSVGTQCVEQRHAVHAATPATGCRRRVLLPRRRGSRNAGQDGQDNQPRHKDMGVSKLPHSLSPRLVRFFSDGHKAMTAFIAICHTCYSTCPHTQSRTDTTM